MRAPALESETIYSAVLFLRKEKGLDVYRYGPEYHRVRARNSAGKWKIYSHYAILTKAANMGMVIHDKGSHTEDEGRRIAPGSRGALRYLRGENSSRKQDRV